MLTLVVSLLSFSGCSTPQKMSVDNINLEQARARVEVRGGYGLVQHVMILTEDNNVLSYNGEEDTEAVVIPVEDISSKLFMEQSLENLQKCEANDVDFSLGVADGYYVQMYIGDKIFTFDYGYAKNPYANILTKILIEHSDIAGINDIQPVP